MDKPELSDIDQYTLILEMYRVYELNLYSKKEKKILQKI